MYILWTLVAILYIVYAIITKKANDTHSWSWVAVLYFLNALGLWPLVSMYSKNIILDGFIYDIIIFVTFYVTMIIMGAGERFTTTQWIASAMMFLGLILFKLG